MIRQSERIPHPAAPRKQQNISRSKVGFRGDSRCPWIVKCDFVLNEQIESREQMRRAAELRETSESLTDHDLTMGMKKGTVKINNTTVIVLLVLRNIVNMGQQAGVYHARH